MSSYSFNIVFPEMAVPLLGIVVLTLFLPLTALTYLFRSNDRRKLEINRILDLLHIAPSYRQVYALDRYQGRDCVLLMAAVCYGSLVSGVGLTLLFLGPQIGLGEFPSVPLTETLSFPQKGSRLVFSMAFLGAYLWGLQYLFQRYCLHDLLPNVYYGLGVRMLFASCLAVIIYNGADALIGNNEGSPSSSLTSNLWPALAFLIGIFPQQGLRWMSARLSILISDAPLAAHRAPLDMIEGINNYDLLRFEELGIETCYDMATADFVPLILRTAYSARQLADWILQAKLCACFGEDVADLRKHGYHTILDLANLGDLDIQTLATETTLTQSALKQACMAVKSDLEILRLQQVMEILSHFSQADEVTEQSQLLLQERQRAERAEQKVAQLESLLPDQGTWVKTS